jgi:hypothetical protein
MPVTGTVLCVRDPRQVAASLAKREGLDREHSASLWLTYTLRAFQNDPACLIVHHEDLVQDPQKVAAHLSAFLGVPPPSSAVSADIDAFVDGGRPESRRGAKPSADGGAEGPAMRLALGVHGILETASAGSLEPLLWTLSEGWQGSSTRAG